MGKSYLYAEEGLPQDYGQALHYLELAAQQGMVNAQFYVGWIYDYALGVEPNAKLAEEWYYKAVVQGHEEAKIAIDALRKTGVHGLATDSSEVKAFKKLLEKAQKTNAASDELTV